MGANNNNSSANNGGDWLRYSSLGIELAVGMALCVLAGFWLDKHVAITFPLFLILGLLAGLTFVVVRLIKIK